MSLREDRLALGVSEIGDVWDWGGRMWDEVPSASSCFCFLSCLLFCVVALCLSFFNSLMILLVQPCLALALPGRRTKCGRRGGELY